MISQQQFIEQFREQYIGDDAAQIEFSSEFRKISSWDSLTGMALIVMIKDTYNVDMTADDLKSCVTVKDVYDFVEAKAVA